LPLREGAEDGAVELVEPDADLEVGGGDETRLITIHYHPYSQHSVCKSA
jgi:hypothetical protein